MNHLSMSHDFVVVENLTLNAFIICDFMYKFNVVINFVNRTVSLWEAWLASNYAINRMS